MMNYEQFKVAVMDGVRENLPEEFKNYELTILQFLKVNVHLDGMQLEPPKDMTKGSQVAVPTLYVNYLYDSYLNGDSLLEIVTRATDILVNSSKHVPKINIDEHFKENIAFRLINTEKNKELLKRLPNREFCDLSIIYIWILDDVDSGFASANITNELAAQFGLDEKQLFDLAMKNSNRILPGTIQTLESTVRTQCEEMGMSMEEFDAYFDDVPDELKMYVLTNSKNMYGTSTILYDNLLEKLADKLGNDLFILPSSIHECIISIADMSNLDEFESMVTEINRTQVAVEELLSNHVYYYNRKSKKIDLAVNVRKKRRNEIQMPLNSEALQTDIAMNLNK